MHTPHHDDSPTNVASPCPCAQLALKTSGTAEHVFAPPITCGPSLMRLGLGLGLGLGPRLRPRSARGRLRGLWSGLPELCPACRGPTARGFCIGCQHEFARIVNPCLACGLPRPVIDCPRANRPWSVGRLTTPYAYAPPLNHYLQALKFNHGRRLGRALGLLLAEALTIDFPADTLLMAVPLHRRRLRERGYNQAFEIMRYAATELGLASHAAGIVRTLATAPQSTLGAGTRQRNMIHAFRVDADVEGRHIIVIDDIVTTGSTINALASALLASGADHVDALAVARTLPGQRPR